VPRAEPHAVRKARQCIESLVRGSRPDLLNTDGTFNKAKIARIAGAIARHQRTLEPDKPWKALMGSSLQRMWFEARVARPGRLPARGKQPALISHESGGRPRSLPQAETPNLLSPKAVMFEAWTIFRETYNYPAVSFRSIGRQCVASALRQAWDRARERVRLISLPQEAFSAELDRLGSKRALLEHPPGDLVQDTRASIPKLEGNSEAALILYPASPFAEGSHEAD
jgi:hypothetical protein